MSEARNVTGTRTSNGSVLTWGYRDALALPTAKAVRRDPQILQAWDTVFRSHAVNSVVKYRVSWVLAQTWAIVQHDGATTTPTRGRPTTITKPAAMKPAIRQRRTSSAPPVARDGARIVQELEQVRRQFRRALLEPDRSRAWRVRMVRVSDVKMQHLSLDLIEEIRTWLPRDWRRVVVGVPDDGTLDGPSDRAGRTKPLTDKQHAEILRLRGLGLSYRDIARKVGCGRSAAQRYVVSQGGG